MSLYVLDTDVLTFLYHGNPNVTQQVLAHSGDVIAITVITAEEAIRGRLNHIPRQTRPDRIALAYAEFAATVAFVAGFQILPYRESTITLFTHLRGLGLPSGPNDLRIAAIALEHNGIVVTHNRSDFNRIPGLTVEDWTV